jgi:hypothetical protein
MTPKPRNWANFHRAQQDRQRRAFAEGQHRPPPLVIAPLDDAPPEDDTNDQDQDHD